MTAFSLLLALVAVALVSLGLNLDLSRQRKIAEGKAESKAVGYPGLAGSDLEDGIYLLALVTWLGWLVPFFVAAGIGVPLYCLWTLGRVVRARASR